MLRIYDAKLKKWRKETKAEVMEKIDIEGKKPCEKCWTKARIGIYAWPVENPAILKRCIHCGRVVA